MLIIPIQNKPDWSRPPLITIALILINLLVFLLYQGNDQDFAEAAENIYLDNGLLKIEREYYIDYLRSNDADTSVPADIEQQPDEHFYWNIFYDRGFDHYLASLWEEAAIPSNEETQRWRAHREEFQQQRNRISSIEAGLTPAEAKPWTFITSLFLHGGWEHLIGNMVFLFLFGFALETALRPHLYLAMYLVSGIAADLLFMAINPDSFTPLVGASGAISGLMGMYLALYRLRRIRFFYTVFFYFGEFRAPALFVLPVWLAKELYGHFFVDSNTAYWAHIGGLLAGAGMMLLAQGSQKQFSAEEEIKVQDDKVEQGLKKIQLASVQLDYKKARALARWLCDHHPTDCRPWRALFDLHKIQPQQKAFHQATFAVLKQFSKPETPFAEWQPFIDEILAEYRDAAPQAPALTGDLYVALARKTWRSGSRHQGEALLKLAQKKQANPRAMIHFLKEVRDYYHKHRQTARAERSEALIQQLQDLNPPASPAAD